MPPPTNPMIGLTPETLLITDVKDIFAETTPGNAWTNRTPQQIIRTGIDGSIPISTPIHSEKSKYPTPDSSDINGTRGTKTRITIGTTAPPCSLNVSLNIDNIRKSATPDLRKSNNWTLPLMDISPIIWLCRPFSLRYSVENSLTVPAGISTSAVG